jgi:Cys-tRNA(Pro) deacylase
MTNPTSIAFFVFSIIILYMAKERFPTTPALLELKAKGALFALYAYKYEDKGGTKAAALKLGIAEHSVIKTLIMEDETGKPLIILMHGDKEVSTKSLARILGVKSITPCQPQVAQRYTGYKVGGTSPFGTKRKMPVYVEKTIGDLTNVFINAGSRGLLAKMSPAQIIRILQPIMVSVAI